jgi:hypothetical protein
MLAVYGPLHYQELPELVMDVVASLSGKSTALVYDNCSKLA